MRVQVSFVIADCTEKNGWTAGNGMTRVFRENHQVHFSKFALCRCAVLNLVRDFECVLFSEVRYFRYSYDFMELLFRKNGWMKNVVVDVKKIAFSARSLNTIISNRLSENRIGSTYARCESSQTKLCAIRENIIIGVCL